MPRIKALDEARSTVCVKLKMEVGEKLNFHVVSGGLKRKLFNQVLAVDREISGVDSLLVCPTAR
jgi:hypothetical protein